MGFGLLVLLLIWNAGSSFNPSQGFDGVRTYRGADGKVYSVDRFNPSQGFDGVRTVVYQGSAKAMSGFNPSQGFDGVRTREGRPDRR